MPSQSDNFHKVTCFLPIFLMELFITIFKEQKYTRQPFPLQTSGFSYGSTDFSSGLLSSVQIHYLTYLFKYAIYFSHTIHGG